MKKILIFLTCIFSITASAQTSDVDKGFHSFEDRFLDAYWKQHPSDAIEKGYGKYYEELEIPDSTAFAGELLFSNQWLDSLHMVSFDALNENNKISYNIIKIQLQRNKWYIDTFKIQQWDAASYNIGSDCSSIITQQYAPLDVRLRTLSKHLEHVGAYYAAALKTLFQPTKEHVELAIEQNKGSLEIFGKALTDSINISHLDSSEKNILLQHVSLATTAIKDYVAGLKKIIADSNYHFRSFRIGKKLYDQKFQYDIVTNYSADEIFNKAILAKNNYHKEMYSIADKLWPKYCDGITKPADSLLLIRTVIDKISLHHVSAENVFDTLNKQVQNLERFIIKKDLFDFDTTAPIYIRKIPAFAGGVTFAFAEFPLPYQKTSAAYYYIADLSAMPPAIAESDLRENNDYILQLLSIHECMPGHCLQGIYSSTKSPDIIKSVFTNSSMAEGWAVYGERMMLDNGWGNNSAEMWLMYDKWALRECTNVIVDYGLHCLNYSKQDIVTLLKNEAFQEDAQIEEKYHRATLSQVQLCFYFTSSTEIFALRDAYKKQLGPGFTLKNFHEHFLSYGTAPVKFIRQAMLNNDN